MAALTPEQQQWFQEQVASSVRQQTAAQSQQIARLTQELEALRTGAQPGEQSAAQPASTRQKQLLEAKIPKPSALQTEEQWPEWSFKIIAFVAATDPQFAATMEEAEAQAHNEGWAPTRAPGGERDAELRYLLVALTLGPALQIVRATAGGLQAYRALARRFNPRSQARSLTMLQSIMRFEFSEDPAGVLDKLVLFERLIMEYEAMTGERLGDNIRCAVLLERLEPDLRTHLLLTCGTRADYRQMKAAVESFAVAKRGWKGTAAEPGEQNPTPVPMEVDYLSHKNEDKKGKGKGKKKGKDDKKGREFQGYCGKCGRWGHRQRDCKQKWGAHAGGVNALDEEETSSAAACSAASAPSSAEAARREPEEAGSVAVLLRQQEGWILTMGSMRPEVGNTGERTAGSRRGTDGREVMELLIDSGATEHVCGPQHFQDFETKSAPWVALRSATGQELEHYGEKRVHLKCGEVPLTITFQVVDVTKAILSVSKLIAKGVRAQLDGQPRLVHPDGSSLRLERRGGLFVMPGITSKSGGGLVAPLEGGAAQEEGADVEGDEEHREQLAQELLGERAVEEAPEPVVAPAPCEPTAEERTAHAATHLPYAPWCAECVMGRGREDRHERQGRGDERQGQGIPVISCDYCFLQTAVRGPRLTVLVATDNAYKHVVAIPVEEKGVQDRGPARALAGFVRYLGLPRVIVQGDPENSMSAVVREACGLITGGSAIARESPRNSKGSNGAAERAIQTIQGYARTLRLDLAKRTGVEVGAEHPITQWLIRHAGWCWSHFHRASEDGRTSYERQFERVYGSQVLPFGERTMWKNPTLSPAKLSSSWGYGLWLGRTMASNAHIVGTRSGALLVRTVRRLPPSEREDGELVIAMRGTPMKAKAMTEGAAGSSSNSAARAQTWSWGAEAKALTASRTEEEQREDPQPEQSEEKAGPAPGPANAEPLKKLARPREPDQDHAAIEDHPQEAPVKRGRGRPPTRVWPKPGSPEYTPGCPGCDGRSYRHNAFCMRRRTETEVTSGSSAGPSSGAQAAAQCVDSSSSGAGPSSAITEQASEMEVDNSTARAGGMERPASEVLVRQHADDWEDGHDAMISAVHPFGHEEPEPVPQEIFEEQVREGAYMEEDTGEKLPVEEVVIGMRRERDLMDSFPVYQAVRESEVSGKIWSTRWCHRRKGPHEVRSRFVVRQFAEKGSSWGSVFYSPTPGLETTRMLLALAVLMGLAVFFADISVAFMNTPMTGPPVHVRPPEGMYREKGVVWRLLRALNGLRDASRLFCEHFAAVACELGFERSKVQPTLFTQASGVFLAIHVDDLLLVGSLGAAEAVLQQLGARFTMKVGGPLCENIPRTFVGARYLRFEGGILELPTPGYVEELLEKAGLSSARPVVTPAVSGDEKEEVNSPALDDQGHSWYRWLVGKLMFLVARRPDLAFATNRLTRKLQQPTEVDARRAKRVLRYLKGTLEWALWLRPRDTRGPQAFLGKSGQVRGGSSEKEWQLVIFSDSDWAANLADRKSVSAFVASLGGVTLQAGCRTQTIVAQSSGEAEFVAATAAASYGKYFQALCSECLRKSVRPTLRVDSTSAIGTASRRGLQRLRHLDTRFLWLQDEVVEKRVLLEKVPGTLNGADSNTKAGDAKALEFGREVMGMVKLNKDVLTLLGGATGAQSARQ